MDAGEWCLQLKSSGSGGAFVVLFGKVLISCRLDLAMGSKPSSVHLATT